MVYYYLKAWIRNKNYFIKIANDAGMISIRDAAIIPDETGYRDILPAKILR